MIGFVVTATVLAIFASVIVTVTSNAERRRHENARAALAEQAADWNEPTRDQVESAYGPRVLWGRPTDAEADAEWADILRAVDLTPADIRERYQASRIADRMDRIRADIACSQLRRAIDDYDGGDVA